MNHRVGEGFQKGTAYNALERLPAALRGAAEKDIGEGDVREPDGEVIRLPEPDIEGGAPLWETIASRRSVRRYRDTPLIAGELSRLLWAVQGVTAREHGFSYRAAPSAGALYPVDTYVVVNNVEGVERGVYLYEPEGHGLRTVRRGDFRKRAREAALGQSMASEAPVFFIWTAVFARGMGKYGQRAFRYFYLDAGHMAGNLSLAAVAMGMGSCQVAAFFDDLSNLLVGADGERETVIYMSSVGRPAGR
jgi:SagB-type dehydrogenase family enzyme